MDLKGAKIRNIHRLCSKIESENPKPLSINIPFYQRPFSWKKYEINKLISDFYQYKTAQGNYNENYFAGSVVTVIREDTAYHDLIDGQQRITTLFLTNYIMFLMLRAYISQLISQKKLTFIVEALNQIEQTAQNIFKDKNSGLHNITEKITPKLSEIEEEKDARDKENKYQELLHLFHKISHLPDINTMQDSYNYVEEYTNNLHNLLYTNNLSLQYSRKAFNVNLKEVLKNIRIQLSNQAGPSLIISDDNLYNDKILSRYLLATRTIFESFENYSIKNPSEISSLDRSNKLLKSMSNFVECLEFCIIQTGSTNDAYTLFEVLNDRSMALSDLDLIKNLFYKHFCQNTHLEESQINESIELLEELWNNQIYKPNDPDYSKKMISFFSTLFLTGNKEINYNERERNRNIIENYLRNNYNISENAEYKFNDIKREFDLMSLIKQLVDDMNLQRNKRALNSLQAENNSNSIVYRSLHLLNALGETKVMGAVINVILKTYLEENNYIIKHDKFKEFLRDIITNNNPSTNQKVYLYDVACQMWRIALLSQDYNIPLKFAKEIISNIHYKEPFKDNTHIDQNTFQQATEEFIEWSKNWQYHLDDHYKIKVLFLNLLKVNLFDNEIQKTEAVHKFSDASKIQLDHIEPANINENFPNHYFMPKNPEDRTRLINQLGNFILIDSSNNKRKSNSPAVTIFEHLNKCGLGPNNWWLTKRLEYLFNTYSINNVPTEQFFIVRKKELINYFYTLLINTYHKNTLHICHVTQ